MNSELEWIWKLRLSRIQYKVAIVSLDAFFWVFDYTQTPLLASFLVSILRVGGSGGERDDSGKTVT